jgi:serine/threonine-protein kinase
MDVGVEFEQYRVIEHIGRGGMADVWSARDKRLSRIVAIKTIARDIMLENDPVKMFEQEARTIAALEHPHILPIYDFGDYQRQLFIAMRYVAGGSMDDLLEQGALQPQDALRLARAVASALDYAHRNSVVHLDLKPSNVLLDSQGSPYLADFGLAAVMDREGRALNPGSGTLLYMAPEQVTSDLLDHRADIYSFCVLLFHMFSGRLPFDGTMPLALQQLQMAEELPDITRVQPNLPPDMNLILRRGTQVDVDYRPSSVLQIMEQFENLLLPGSIRVGGSASVDNYSTELMGGATVNLINDTLNLTNATMQLTGTFPEVEKGTLPLSGNTLQLDTAEQLAQREAVDLYAKARRAWAFGKGRFILGITDFALINDYYKEAERRNLEIDDAGTQMLLRGALEYDVDVAFWWGKLGDDGRRWVALHALRGQNAAARLRALERLEHLPDAEPPQIPKLVASALQVENRQAAKLAAIRVLATRAPGHADRAFEVDEKAGRARTTAFLSRRLRLWTPGEWRPSVYGEDIDRLLATLALDTSDAAVADAASRAVGRMRSEGALRMIAEAEAHGMARARRALALIRDEAPSLPGVTARGRAAAWLTNSWQRIRSKPLQIVWRFALAFIGAALGIGYYVWGTLSSGLTGLAIFNNQNIALTVSLMLFFGFGFGFLVVLAGEVPERVRGFHPWWARLLLSIVLGVLSGLFLFGLYHFMFLSAPFESIDGWSLVPAALGMTAALALGAVYRLHGWLLAMVMVVATFIPISIGNDGYWNGEGTFGPLFFRQFDPQTMTVDPLYSLGIPMVILFALGAFGARLYRELRPLFKRRQMRA